MASINRKFIRSALETLAERRPVFHSEADFQFALAYEMRQQNPELHIRPEWPCGVSESNRTIYLDIVAGENFSPAKTVAIELKYTTDEWQGKFNREEFFLKDQRARNIRRYDFWQDVERLERLKKAGKIKDGYAIMLTNDGRYWSPGVRGNPVDKCFHLRENRNVHGKLRFQRPANAGTIKGKEKPINLRGTYTLKWESYSKIEEQEFRYLLLEANTLGAG